MTCGQLSNKIFPTWFTPNVCKFFDNDMHTMFNVISIIRCNWGWFVTSIPYWILFAITWTCNVESLHHVRNEMLHCFLHHDRHIAGIFPIDNQVVLHKNDGHQLSVATGILPGSSPRGYGFLPPTIFLFVFASADTVGGVPTLPPAQSGGNSFHDTTLGRMGIWNACGQIHQTSRCCKPYSSTK